MAKSECIFNYALVKCQNGEKILCRTDEKIIAKSIKKHIFSSLYIKYHLFNDKAGGVVSW